MGKMTQRESEIPQDEARRMLERILHLEETNRMLHLNLETRKLEITHLKELIEKRRRLHPVAMM